MAKITIKIETTDQLFLQCTLEEAKEFYESLRVVFERPAEKENKKPKKAIEDYLRGKHAPNYTDRGNMATAKPPEPMKEYPGPSNWCESD